MTIPDAPTNSRPYETAERMKPIIDPHPYALGVPKHAAFSRAPSAPAPIGTRKNAAAAFVYRGRAL